MTDIFEYFLANFGLFHTIDDILIEYGDRTTGSVLISRDQAGLFKKGMPEINPSDVAWKEWNGVSIPFLFDKSNVSEIVTYHEDYVTINFDIVASSFYFLSGWDEYCKAEKDQYGRITFNSSIIRKLDIINIPVVNYYFDILNHALSRFHGNTRKKLWNDSKFA